MRQRIVKGRITKITDGQHQMFARDNIVFTAEKKYNAVGVEKGTSVNEPEEPTLQKRLKKFLVHFRRPKDYKGEYGFDWLREEYILPLITVNYDNNGSVLHGAMRPLCKDVSKLKQEYLKNIKNPIAPYGVQYYPAWLSIFPHTTTKQFPHGSSIHKNGVSLDIQFDELETIENDGTEIIIESCHEGITVIPNKFSINEIIASGKKNRFTNPGYINYYLLEKKVNIKCSRPISTHDEIKVYAKLNNQKQEVGKLMIYKNDIIPKMEIVMVNVISKPGSLSAIQNTRIKDYEYNFKRAGFNQAMIRAEVIIYDEFDTTKLPIADADVSNYNNNFVNTTQFRSKDYVNVIVELYNKYGKFKPLMGINTNGQKRTFLFFTELSAGGTRGVASARDGNLSVSFEWGNAYAVFLDGLTNRRTILHEAGHTMGLQHTFSSGDALHGLAAPNHTFYQGYTDNIMDYTWQQGPSANKNPFDTKDKMCSFFKWQWEILQKDRSLIFNY